MRRVIAEDPSCFSGRPRSECGRLCRDGSKALEGSAASITEIGQCANPTIRLYGITTTTSPAHFVPKAADLSIGRGGFILHYTRGARLNGYDCKSIKAYSIAAGLPVIDSRMVAFEDVVRLAVRGRMAAVGEGAAPRPSYVPLTVLANAYPAAGAEVFQRPRPRSACGAGRVRGGPVSP